MSRNSSPCAVPAMSSAGERMNFLRVRAATWPVATRYDAPWLVTASVGRDWRGGSRVMVMLRPPSEWSGRCVVCPVRARNTSSRVGRRSAMSSTGTSASSRARTTMGRSFEPPGAAQRAPARRRIGGRLGHPERRQHLGRPLHGGDVDGVQLDHVGADAGLELVRRALRNDAAVVDDDDGGGEVVGLIEILGRQHDVGPARLMACTASHTSLRLTGVEAGRGLVEQQQAGRADEARPEVEPPSHPAGIGLGPAVGGLHQIHLLENPLADATASARPWP